MPRESDTRLRLVSAARRLFHEQGYTATGIATVLREADVNSGSLYHFFPSKDALLIAVLEEYLAALKPELILPIEVEIEDPLERVFALLDGYRNALLGTEYFFGCPIGNLALEVGQVPGPATELIHRNFEGWREAVGGWIADALPTLPEGITHAGLATFTLTVMEGAVMQARAAKSIEPFDRSVAHLRQHFAGLA